MDEVKIHAGRLGGDQYEDHLNGLSKLSTVHLTVT